MVRKKSEKKPGWLTYKPEEIEQIAIKLCSEGKSAAQVGLILRDQYGIPSIRAATGKRMGKILKQEKIPEDLFDLLKRAVSLHAHLARMKRDSHSRRGLEKTESKIRDLAKYYIKIGKLPHDWKYDAERAKLLVQK